MKKIFILLLSLGSLTAAFAQTGHRGGSQGQNDSYYQKSGSAGQNSHDYSNQPKDNQWNQKKTTDQASYPVQNSINDRNARNTYNNSYNNSDRSYNDNHFSGRENDSRFEDRRFYDRRSRFIPKKHFRGNYGGWGY
jgi:hypothetical protein